MKVISTIKSFDDQMKQFDFLIPSLPNKMENLITRLINLDTTPINVEGLNTIHFTDQYREELFAFQYSVGQQPFATLNKIADGHAQVVLVKEGQGRPEDIGFHIFFSKLIPMAILIGQLCEDNHEKLEEGALKQLVGQKNEYIRMIRHELAHVEDENNQMKWQWLEPAFSDRTLQTALRYDAYRLWTEFYACKRSNFFYDENVLSRTIESLFNDLDKAEEEICDLRGKYNRIEIELNEFVKALHEYVRSALIYCCYFDGHMDWVYDSIAEKLFTVQYPSRFFIHFNELWIALRKMAETYPSWTSPQIYDGVANVVLRCINEFEIYPRQTAEGPYYDIPVMQLKTKLQEAREKAGIDT